MSIPKVIHYCWFGGAPKPESVLYCIQSWKKHCPDYQIIEWNEANYNIYTAPRYVREAYEAKKWAFMTDYVRLQVIYENGGIYMDTDVEVKRNLDELLQWNAYFGFEDGIHIATGLGFGAERNAPILKELMETYTGMPFVLPDGSYNTIPCPQINTEVFIRHGMTQDNTRQILSGNVLILPTICLCPKDYHTGLIQRSRKTYSIHHYDASWYSEEERIKWKAYQKQERINRLKIMRYHFLVKCFGADQYEKLKKILKGR